tara:strand:+ start:385 stop:639 length:255 start_codon:yes stop_codon:yes gene_type:complete
MIYKLYISDTTVGSEGNTDAVVTVDQVPQKSFLFDKANTDFIEFKNNLTAGATLQNINGAVMNNASVSNVLTQLNADALKIEGE